MAVLLIILLIIFTLILVAAPIVFMQTRKVFREQKNYERGLKMVPMLIHLPPASDDIDVGNRDVRDVTDETISKATLIYNIVASTLKKDFKSNFYGQRHFAFEIVGTQGFVYFYVAVPLAMLEVVKQAINSAYPSARLEEVSEHNIFSPVGKVSGTIGGELVLKENYAYPIATYQDLKRDAMQSLLNALWSLGKEDGAGIQILIRPANPSWRKAASSVADRKRKGDKGLGMGGLAKDVVTAFSKPPDGSKDGESKKKPELSNMEQATLDAIDEKTRHPGFEVAIRIVASSNVSQRAQAVLNNIVASFALYDAPGKNGFKFTLAKDIDGLITSYIMRFFPQQHNKNILNAVELATIFHFPDEGSIPTSQLARQDSKQVDGPRNIPEEGLLLGYNLFRGTKKPIRLGLGDRQRHMYVVGQTGTGKSTYLENLALQDMLSGNGFAFVDPHGDTAERLLSMVPKERTEDVIYFSPADMEYPMGLNLFEFSSPDQKDFLIQEALNMLYKLYDPQHQGIMGPRYEHLFRNAALTIMADPQGGTFVDIPKLFRDSKFVQQKLQHVTDMNVLEFWNKEMPASQRSNDFGEVTSWFVSKFGAFLSNEMMRNIIGQTKSAFDLRDVMDNKKILLVNLSKGRTGELNSKLLGMVFVMKFQAAAMSRSDIPEEQRVDFSLYVDEFQNFSTESFATIMSEARKYHLNLIVANQFTTQLTEEIRDAVFGNIGTIVSFRVGQNDIDSIGRYFQPTFDADDLLRVPNHNTIVRTLIGGVPTHPFSMATLPPLGTPNPRLAIALKQLAAAKYGRPKSIVDKEINERMVTKGEPLPGARGFGNPPLPAGAGGPRLGAARAGALPAAAAGGPLTPPASPVPPAAKSGSFLDEWLNKRRTGTVTPSAPKTAPLPPAAPAPSPAETAAAAATATPMPAPAAPNSVIAPAAPVPVPAPPAESAQINKQERTALKDQVPAHVEGMSPSEPQPFHPPDGWPAAQAAKSDEPATTKNISSTELEQSEVDKIAAELKQELGSTPAPAPAPDPATPPYIPAPETPPPAPPVPPTPKTEHSVDLRSSGSPQGEDDTIFIDRDGTFRISDKKD